MKQYMKYLSMAALVIVGALIAGCAGFEENQPQREDKVVTLTTTVGFGSNESTKALTAAGKKTFAENDKIAVIYKNSSDQTKTASVQLFASDISDGGKTASVSVTMENPAENSQLRLIYPASMIKTPIETNTPIDDANTIDYYSLQHSQNGYLGTLGDDFDLAVYDGKMNGDQLPASITLENKLAICAFTIKNSDGTQDLTSTITNLTVSDGTNTYTIGRSAGVGPIYVAIKPVSGADITLTATDEYGQHYAKSVTNKTYAANNIYPLGMRMAETYKTYSTIPAGTLLKVGDQIDPPANIYINGDVQTMVPTLAPYTLVRANVDGSTVTEAANGTHYVFKDKDGAFYGKDINLLASEASDGLYVSGYHEGMHSYTMLSHVNLANVTADYTAHTYDYLYGTLNPSLNLYVASGGTVWLGGMTHHAGQNVSGIECQGSATINLVEGTTNDLTSGNEYAYNGICIDEETLTIAGTGTLWASGGLGSRCAGIGGYASTHIVIDGGNITATGGYNAAGIGSDSGFGFGNITINGGNVTATGGENAAGIGCGNHESGYSSCGDITFNGGKVVVNAGAEDGWGVGLETGDDSNYNCGDINFVGGNVTVNGNIATKSPYGIYYGEEKQKFTMITASAQSPFVYPIPATQ